ncbi:hypothetical protein VTH8203_03194 [Vibrio thalassae]|uniref:Uncharacterized protein n=1 Tax=Vibrio thalassae TaxID=1243014 RepID=A0A240ELP9_9VIBR|nr:hypothetical protein VTH8203_03194 [Vibrio thalassae]
MVVGALNYRHQRYLLLLESCHDEPGLTATLSAFDTLSHWMKQHAPKGCLSANALAAFPDNTEIHFAVETYKHKVIQHLAQISGREDLSQALYVLHEGITAAYPFLGEAAVSAAKDSVSALFTTTTSHN